MKKILGSLVIMGGVFILTACTTPQALVNDEQLNIVDEMPGIENLNNNVFEPEALPPVNNINNNSTDNSVNNDNNMLETNTIMSPDKQVDLTKVYSQAILKTSVGNITLKFYPDETPLTVNNFLNLAEAGFYNGTKFHRVMKDFMIQGGDPSSRGDDASTYGTGGPGYKFKNENGSHKLVAGSIAMANSGLNTNGSQFFIVTVESAPFLDGGYTNFGEVAGGMETVRKIENSPVTRSARGELSIPVDYVTINSIELVK